jgi:hypothetical protein
LSEKDLSDHTAHYLSFSRFQKLLRAHSGLFSVITSMGAPPKAGKAWQGLSRYLSDAEHLSVHPVEYAKALTLLECPELDVTYYSDAAGKVPTEPKGLPGLAGLETVDIGNGDLSPEWGVDVKVVGGMVTYGPWANRQMYVIREQRCRVLTTRASQTRTAASILSGGVL